MSAPYTEAIPKIEAALKAAGATSVEIVLDDDGWGVSVKARYTDEDAEDRFNDVIEVACKDLGWLYLDLDGDALAPYAILRWDEPRVPASIHAETLADLAEARAEIAALRGLPEGAVGSGWVPTATGGAWVYRLPRSPHDHLLARHDNGTCSWWIYQPNDRRSGTAPTLRDAMRAALAALGVKS